MLACVSGAVASCAALVPSAATNDTTAQPVDIWRTIDELRAQMPLSVASVEAAISVSLTDEKQQHNDWFQFYKSNAIALDDAVVIRSADLRVRRTPPHPALLVLNLEGRCITIDEVRGHFAPLRITGVPRGHSREELTTHSFAASWGRLSFSFKESNPTCVAVVVFHPAELR